MPIRVKTNLKAVSKKFSPTNINRGRFLMANQMVSDMEQFVPKQSGDLRAQKVIANDGSHIDYTAPYARAQFYGFVGKKGARVHHYSTTGTSRRWDLRAKGKHIEDWKKAFIKGAELD